MIAPGCSSCPLPIAHCPLPVRRGRTLTVIYCQTVRFFAPNGFFVIPETAKPFCRIGLRDNQTTPDRPFHRTKLVRSRIATPVAIADKQPEYKERVDASRGTATISAIAA